MQDVLHDVPSIAGGVYFSKGVTTADVAKLLARFKKEMADRQHVAHKITGVAADGAFGSMRHLDTAGQLAPPKQRVLPTEINSVRMLSEVTDASVSRVFCLCSRTDRPTQPRGRPS